MSNPSTARNEERFQQIRMEVAIAWSSLPTIGGLAERLALLSHAPDVDRLALRRKASLGAGYCKFERGLLDWVPYGEGRL